MDVRGALREQYHASLAMLADCVRQCPDDMWTAGEHPRTFWRIAAHAAFFAHLYMGQDLDAYRPWTDGPAGFRALWEQSEDVEPFELPVGVAPLSRDDTLAYIAFVGSLVDPTVDALDLDRADTGIPWYQDMSKLSHEMMTVRHIQEHVGQLSERLLARGIDTRWFGKAPALGRG